MSGEKDININLAKESVVKSNNGINNNVANETTIKDNNRSNTNLSKESVPTNSNVDNNYDMDEIKSSFEEGKNVPQDPQMTDKEKAEQVDRDIAELVAKGFATYYGGAVGYRAVNIAAQTKIGKGILNVAGKIGRYTVTKPIWMRNSTYNRKIAKNQKLINGVKNVADTIISQQGSSSGQGSGGGQSGDSSTKNTGMDSFIAKLIDFSLSLSAKMAILGVVLGLCCIVMFIVVMLTPLMEQGIIDIGGTDSSISGSGNISSGNTTNDFSSIPSSTSYWWPVGGSTSNVGGVTFATTLPYKVSITSYYGIRKHPISGVIKKHSGIDIVGGINIIAVADGTVIYPSNSDKMNCPTSNTLDDCGHGYGNYVMIMHNDGNTTLYAHLYENSITVRAGDSVKQGQLIAKMGSSGNSTGTHLHFEVRTNNTSVEPLNYISASNPRP